MTDVFSYITVDDPWESVMPFEVQVVSHEDRQTLVLRGDLDISSAGQLEAVIREACSSGTPGLILDLGEVTYMDSSGLRVIIAAGRMCEELGNEFALVPGPPEVQRLFELMGLSENLRFTTTSRPPARRRKGR
jgi:anti-anti-sigma factor